MALLRLFQVSDAHVLIVGVGSLSWMKAPQAGNYARSIPIAQVYCGATWTMLMRPIETYIESLSKMMPSNNGIPQDCNRKTLATHMRREVIFYHVSYNNVRTADVVDYEHYRNDSQHSSP